MRTLPRLDGMPWTRGTGRAGAHHAEMLAGFRVDDCAVGVEDDGAILLIKKMQGAQLHGKKNLAEVGAPRAEGRDDGGGTLGREQGRVHADTMNPAVGQMRSYPSPFRKSNREASDVPTGRD